MHKIQNYFFFIFSVFKRADDENPLMFYALYALLGAFFSLFLNPTILILFFFLMFFKNFQNHKNNIRKLLLGFFFFSLFFSMDFFIYKPHQIKDGFFKKAVFSIDSIKPYTSLRKKGFIYSGNLEIDKNKKIPINTVYYGNFKRPSPSNSYKLSGEISKQDNFNYYFKPLKNSTWVFHEKKNNFLEKRQFLKNKLKRFINKKIKNRNAKSFYNGILTGNIDDLYLSYYFNKCGLSHILAISGFHFGLIILFFSFFLKIFFSRKISSILLLIIVNLYFLFLGYSPSIFRAYLMCFFFLISILLNRKNYSINILFLSLILSLILYPLSFTKLSFQLSYLCCFALLSLYQPIEKILENHVLFKRSYSDLNFLNKIGYFFIEYLRKIIAILFSINLFITPVVLFYFHKMPILNFFYNMFFPLLASISIFLILFAFLINFIIPPLGALLFSLCNKITSYFLDLVYFYPPSMDLYIEKEHVSINFLAIYLGIMFFIAIFLKYFDIKNYRENDVLNFF
jgi:competence protein ComEC